MASGDEATTVDHVSVQVSDVTVSRAFYTTVLAPLGLRPEYADGAWTGYADAFGAPLWIGPAERDAVRELHLAFRAADREMVHAFYAAARASGAEILHTPQPFPTYGPHYFACFVRDPDGHNIEAVCRTDPGQLQSPPRADG